jgi:hypothetical protein
VAASLAAAALIAATPASAGAAAKKKPTSVTATSGAVTAKVTYQPVTRPFKQYRHLRLTVTGPSGKLTAVKLPHNGASGSRPHVTLVDLNGDGVVDPLIDTFTGGAHCCSIASVALSNASGWGAPITQFFGDYGYELKDLGGTASPEFVSADDRFAYAYTAYAGSIPPIQIWSPATGAFTDVTRQFPDAIRADLVNISKFWDEAGGDTSSPQGVQSATGAWVAELALLGDYDGAKAVLAKTAAAGYLTGGDTYAFQDSKTFSGQLGHDLKAWGYLTDPALVGLTDG